VKRHDLWPIRALLRECALRDRVKLCVERTRCGVISRAPRETMCTSKITTSCVFHALIASEK